MTQEERNEVDGLIELVIEATIAGGHDSQERAIFNLSDWLDDRVETEPSTGIPGVGSNSEARRNDTPIRDPSNSELMDALTVAADNLLIQRSVARSAGVWPVYIRRRGEVTERLTLLEKLIQLEAEGRTADKIKALQEKLVYANAIGQAREIIPELLRCIADAKVAIYEHGGYMKPATEALVMRAEDTLAKLNGVADSCRNTEVGIDRRIRLRRRPRNR